MQRFKCQSLPHGSRTLQDHLLGTAAISESRGNSLPLTLACSVHSIYGTDAYKATDQNIEDRAFVAHHLGGRAEILAYCFHRISRKKDWYKDFLTPVLDRLTGEEFSLKMYLPDLREIEFCNLLEQGAA
jgi:hypothetical protein